jgi:hypothetical protein
MRFTYRLRRAGLLAALVFAPLLLLVAVLIAYRSQVWASSHREAPLISSDPSADATDTYMFISPENADNVVFVGSWIPFEGPEGAPNYFEWDDTALYDIYVDNDGDAQPNITFTLSSKVKPTGGSFLYNNGPIGAAGENWLRKQYYTVTEQGAGRQQAGPAGEHRQQVHAQLHLVL